MFEYTEMQYEVFTVVEKRKWKQYYTNCIK